MASGEGAGHSRQKSQQPNHRGHRQARPPLAGPILLRRPHQVAERGEGTKTRKGGEGERLGGAQGGRSRTSAGLLSVKLAAVAFEMLDTRTPTPEARSTRNASSSVRSSPMYSGSTSGASARPSARSRCSSARPLSQLTRGRISRTLRPRVMCTAARRCTISSAAVNTCAGRT